MKRFLYALLAVLLFAARASAQIDLGSASITAASSGSACTAVRAGCAEFYNFPNAVTSITLQVTGTFSATLAFEGTSSADPATGTWFAITLTKLSDGSSATSTTATGQFSIANSGLTGIRARCTSFSSGTAVVAAVRGYAIAQLRTPFFTTGYFGDGSASAPSIAFANDTDVGIYRVGSNQGAFTANGNDPVGWGQTSLRLASSSVLTWTSGGIAAGGDINLARTSSGVLGLTGALTVSAPALTVGSGTGVTVNDVGSLRELVYKVTIDRTAFVAAAVTSDVTIATFPAKTQLVAVMADLTQTFACTATCTSSTLSFVLGRGSGGAQFLASFDADAAAAQFGDADAELGTTMTRAAAIQAGSFEAWASTQAVVLRLTSGTGNIGNGSATNLSQGSVTIYLVARVLP